MIYLFYSIYEIFEWSNRIGIVHKRTHENIKTEQKNSPKMQNYVFPLQKIRGKYACLSKRFLLPFKGL